MTGSCRVPVSTSVKHLSKHILSLGPDLLQREFGDMARRNFSAAQFRFGLCFSAQNYSVRIRESSSKSPFFAVIWVELMTSFDSAGFSMMIN